MEVLYLSLYNFHKSQYNQLYFVIDKYTSSKDLFFNNYLSYRKITLDVPLQKGETLSNNFYFVFNGQEFREYTLFIYVRKNINGENLSLPLKIIAYLNEDPEEIRKREEEEKDKENIKQILNIEFKVLDKEEVYQIYKELDNEYNMSAIFDKEEIFKKIIEYNCDKEKMDQWIEYNL